MTRPGLTGACRRLVRLGAGRSVACVDTGGDGPAIVAVHGYSDNSRSFAPIAPFLRPRRLVMPDLRGHGGSFRAATYRLADFVADLADLVDRLALARPVLVGHSLGALVCLAAAAEHPGIARAVVTLAGTVAPRLSSSGISAEIRALNDPIDPASLFFDTWHHCEKPVDGAFLSAMARESAAIPADVWRAVLSEIADLDLGAKAATIAVPCLLIGGGRDRLFDATHHERLAAAVPGAKAVLLADCGHNMHWEDPRAVAAEIEAFLAALQA